MQEKLLFYLTAKPVVVFKPESVRFGDYRRCRSSHFVTGFACIWHKREKIKNAEKLNPKTSKRFQMLPSASERVPTHSGRSEQVQTRLRTYKNFEKLAKTSRNFRERRLRAIVVCVSVDVADLWG